MFKSTILIVFRSAARKPGQAIFNILGLVTGFTVFLAALAFVHHERSFDGFFPNAERIVALHTGLPEDALFDMDTFSGTIPAIASEVRLQLPEVEAASLLINSDNSITVNNTTNMQTIRYTDADFFRIFTLDFLAGNASGWNLNVDGALISRRLAENLFGTTDPVADFIGRTLTLDNNTDLTVTGIYEDLQANSHFSENGDNGPMMGMIANYRLYERLNDVDFTTMWNSISSDFTVYLLLANGTDLALLEEDLTALVIARVSDGMKNLIGSIIPVPLKDIHLLFWERQEIPALKIATAAGALILFIAILNTISLNTARLIGRTREISLRRIVGASRRNLISQLLLESTMTTVFALVLAILLLGSLLPWASDLSGYAYELSPFMDIGTVLTLIGISLLVAVLSASYPVMLLTGLSRGLSLARSVHLGHSAAWMRKLMVVVQFTMVTALVLAVIIVNRQNSYLFDRAPDFNASRVVTISGLDSETTAPRMPAITMAMQRIPGVDLVAQSASAPFSGFLMASIFEDPAGGEPFTMQIVVGDDHYLPLFGLDLIAGRNFDRTRGDDVMTIEESRAEDAARDDADRDDETTEPAPVTRNVIINDSAWRRLGFLSAQDAVGKTFRNGGDQSNTVFHIIGILPDININDFDSEVRPTIFRYEEQHMQSLAVRFTTPDMVDIQEINRVLEEYLPDELLQIQSMSETIEAQMQDFWQVQTALLVVAIIAIILAATGLYALAAFLAASKKKEMGIRKVMGASSRQLTEFLLWQFSRPVVLSLVIGLPMGWLMMGRYLEGFTDRITPGADLILAAAVVTIVIAILSVLTHAIRTARTRPAHVLRVD